ncbi:DUF1996 domain-containing protein [Streptomyces sp. APSN-46.1]|uniref:DUF1996 domain-containing protein n=1 Tax=Streptomyces sp. APSN-46.1 TaxID=2929049 RepID=UPI001FB5075F|nr:DUF1996 domain-containing protein [Streptomyces sp. APSN-46.1]MCJ1676050.1 DUF1996 domain-containing protein [Streptomyces sp. APSN-46.1]
MSQKGHKRRLKPAHKALAVVSALVLGGGGVVIVAQGASAGQGSRTAPVTATIDCPDVGDQLRAVPDEARKEVDENLAKLDTQIADAYQRLSSGGASGDALLGELKQERGTTITRISDAIARTAERPGGLEPLSACTMKKAAAADPADEAGGGSAAARSATPQAAKGGPARSDFVAIGSIRPNVKKPAARTGASTGSFVVQCGRNENRHLNPDNVIVAPGVSNGAHHMHDYVGNKTADAFSTNKSLAASGTTCTNGDQSTYYWPVLRLRDGRAEKDANAPGGGKDANVGTILQPKQVTIEFKGSPAGKVTAMPRFLRIITGDAKALTNGPGNANASWSCTGFENRQLKDKYPVCPKGSDVVRTFNFQSCWDGKNTDSANHRTHVAFADRNGSCPAGFKAIPQLVQRITYAVPAGSKFAVDSFPEQLHKPGTDHGDFINVMSNGLMANAVGCINGGRACR